MLSITYKVTVSQNNQPKERKTVTLLLHADFVTHFKKYVFLSNTNVPVIFDRQFSS